MATYVLIHGAGDSAWYWHLLAAELRDRGQAWFWTREWQAGEREANEQASRGEGERFEADADVIDSLE